MTRALFALPLLLALGACATPRESCIASVTHDQRVIDRLIAQTQANIARGYALETRQEVVRLPDFCRVTADDGSVRLVSCDRVQVQDHQVPVAIDLNAEQAKLTSLLQRQRQMRDQTAAAVAQCKATYPEE
ncbi:MAG: hypothetical protein GC146_09675 [Limimaricola sp.]|uniref:hypothetical protein n=1 Tax=Limimaricola sp. TaxID=2211665 RepID=UPI001DBC2EB9|nr:hypothetical protein [Limimaricola sp.]MBI1417477.1 hypothetical protein [Limimaricola sp.]